MKSMYDVVYIFRGILIGLMVSVPLGPMGVLIIQKTLQKGALAGFVAGMGAACADLFYATVAAFGLGFVINVIQTHELILQIIGGIFLIIVGLKIYFDNPLKQIRMKKRVTKKGLQGDFLTLFFLTVSNPVAIVVFMAVFAGASVFGDDPSYRIELFVLSGVVIGAVCFVLARPMIRLFYGSIDADVLDAGVKYLQIIALSYPFLALYNGGAALFRSIGNSKISMQISFLMNIINIVGNAVCIFGFKMGVDGVAWPSVVSRVVAAALILRKCYREDAVLTVPKTLRLDGGMAKRILGIGIPSAFENSLFEAGRILVVSMISTFGTVQIAANAVANNLDGMGVIPGKAISLAMITVVGRCIGAGDHEQTVYYTRKLLLWAYITMGLSNGAILLFLRQLVGIYALSGETMELAITLVTIHAGCAIIFWPLSFVLPNALRAANDVKFTMVVSILSMACWRLGFSYLLCVRMGWGAVGVWVAMVIDWTCRVTCFVLRFRSGAWKTKYQA